MKDKPTNTLIDLQVIPPKTDLQITVSTDLYIRLQQLLLEALPYKDREHFLTIVRSLKENTSIKDPLAYHVQTLMHVLNLVELSAKATGKLETQKFDTLTGKLVVKDEAP